VNVIKYASYQLQKSSIDLIYKDILHAVVWKRTIPVK